LLPLEPHSRAKMDIMLDADRFILGPVHTMTPRLDVNRSNDPRARARIQLRPICVVRPDFLAESFQPGQVGMTIQHLRLRGVCLNPGLPTSLWSRSVRDDSLGGDGRICGNGIGCGLDA
jgi:hypothetical protein